MKKAAIVVERRSIQEQKLIEFIEYIIEVYYFTFISYPFHPFEITVSSFLYHLYILFISSFLLNKTSLEFYLESARKETLHFYLYNKNMNIPKYLNRKISFQSCVNQNLVHHTGEVFNNGHLF